MKKIIVIIYIILIAPLLTAKDIDYQKSFRGISFFPKHTHKVKGISIEIPSGCQRSDTLHGKFNYPVTAFVANCTNSDSCFSLLIMVSVVPDQVKDYESLVNETIKRDYSEEPYLNKPWMEYDNSRADKMQILFGPDKLMGNVVNGFYYDKSAKETYAVSTRLIYSGNFPDDDWRAILLNTFLIYNSITFLEG